MSAIRQGTKAHRIPTSSLCIALASQDRHHRRGRSRCCRRLRNLVDPECGLPSGRVGAHRRPAKYGIIDPFTAYIDRWRHVRKRPSSSRVTAMPPHGSWASFVGSTDPFRGDAGCPYRCDDGGFASVCASLGRPVGCRRRCRAAGSVVAAAEHTDRSVAGAMPCSATI